MISFIILFCCIPFFIHSRSDSSLYRIFLDWLPLLITLFCYDTLKHFHANTLTQLLGILPKDDWMIYIDKLLFGEVLPLKFEFIISPTITAVMLIAYMWLFFLMPTLVLFYFYITNKLAQFYLVRKALVFCLLGGYILYILVPVAGPVFTMQDLFTSPLGHGVPDSGQVFSTMRYNWDCFPSLHTAVPTLLTLMAWWHVKSGAKLILLISTMTIIISTLYLRQHYGIDVIAGVIWAIIIAKLSHYFFR